MNSPRVAWGLLALLAFALSARGQEPDSTRPAQRRDDPHPVYAPVVDDPALPRVLLIGDSISVGYTFPVRELLAGKANVHRIPTNGGPTKRGLEQLDAWLGEGCWDVIHFNWGLHDLKYVDDNLAPATAETGHRQVPLEQYGRNLRKLVARLKKTGAKLIWCTTTPVPEGANARKAGDEIPYNDLAAEIMRDEAIEVDDLWSFAKPQLDKIQGRANVHFSESGSAVLATQVADSIEAALGK